MTTLRHVCPFGPCIGLGKLVRETRRNYFFIIQGNRHAFIPKRSSAIHLNPCSKCPDMKRIEAHSNSVERHQRGSVSGSSGVQWSD